MKGYNFFKTLWDLFRIEQWLKNLLIFFPAFFGGELFDLEKAAILIAAFIAYSFIASAVYILNDYFDISKDRLHTEKQNRPLASGKVSVSAAFVCFGVLVVTSILIGGLINRMLPLVLLVYLILNIGYSVKLKNIAIIDVNIIAIGFLLRVLTGGLVAGVIISNWLWIMTYLLALIIALGKRHSEVVGFNKTQINTRTSIEGYNLEFINGAIIFMAGVLVVSYIMYTISPNVTERLHSDYVFVTSAFVVTGILRFLQQTLVFNRTGSPTKLIIRDTFLQVIIGLWLLSFLFFIY